MTKRDAGIRSAWAHNFFPDHQKWRQVNSVTYSQGGDFILVPLRAGFNVRDLRHRLMGIVDVCGRSPDLQRLHFHGSVVFGLQGGLKSDL